jgi:cytochrome P450
MTLLLAGHETTAMALTWTWYLLDQNPAAARALHDELARVLAGRAPTITDIADLPYTRGVVHESLRLFPPAWIIGRRALADVRAGEWTIPAGSLIVASPWVVHRHPDYWSSPLAYRPQRWLDEDGNFDESAPGQPRGAWFPFGWGNRRCIGDQFALIEAVLVVASLAQRWTPRPERGRPVLPAPLVTLRPREGLPATLIAR